MSYPRYGWVGNKISEEDMGALFNLKLQTHRPITEHVAEAVSIYVKERKT